MPYLQSNESCEDRYWDYQKCEVAVFTSLSHSSSVCRRNRNQNPKLEAAIDGQRSWLTTVDVTSAPTVKGGRFMVFCGRCRTYKKQRTSLSSAQIASPNFSIPPNTLITTPERCPSLPANQHPVLKHLRTRIPASGMHISIPRVFYKRSKGAALEDSMLTPTRSSGSCGLTLRLSRKRPMHDRPQSRTTPKMPGRNRRPSLRPVGTPRRGRCLRRGWRVKCQRLLIWVPDLHRRLFHRRREMRLRAMWSSCLSSRLRI